MRNKKQEKGLFDLLNIDGLSSSDIRCIAHDCGFVKRASKKIDPIEFLALTCLESQKGSPSYNDLASRIDSVLENTVSRQAVWKRVNDSCVIFFKAILARLIKVKLSDDNGQNYAHKRVLVQDSTIIRLPLRLFKKFSGVANASSSVCSARIQGVYDLLSGQFISFSIDPYSKNDISAAHELELKEGDLVLRDRGYFTNNEIRRHVESNADCIYRYKYKTLFIHPDSGETINLVDFLKPGEKLEIDVCLNNKKKTNVRLTAMPVNEEIANRRRQKAKKESKGHNPSKEVLFLMSWTIFITTIPKQKADFDTIFNIYRLRWRIETIFKSWKSHMNFDKVHNVSDNQLNVILISRFIMIIISSQLFYAPCKKLIKQKLNRELSMIKFCNYLMVNSAKVYELAKYSVYKENFNIPYKLINSISRYACYDKRKRLNFNEMQDIFLLS